MGSVVVVPHRCSTRAPNGGCLPSAVPGRTHHALQADNGYGKATCAIGGSGTRLVLVRVRNQRTPNPQPMRHITRPSTLFAALLAVMLFACNASKGVKGGAIGAGVGAGAGAVIGNQFEGENGTVIGALIGAAIGGTTGALIGHQMDKQAEDLRNDLQGATVTRVGEGIRITFDSGLLFAVDKSDVNPTAQENLTRLASTLNKYDDTEVLIEGHTDTDGPDGYNQELSMRRAKAVASALEVRGVRSGRISAKGYGESQPVADNADAVGKSLNRRVEVAIYANKRMKKAAERGEL